MLRLSTCVPSCQARKPDLQAENKAPIPAFYGTNPVQRKGELRPVYILWGLLIYVLLGLASRTVPFFAAHAVAVGSVEVELSGVHSAGLLEMLKPEACRRLTFR